MGEVNIEDGKNELDKLKEIVLNDYQYYDRRYDTVSMVFSGFGLYGCFEMLKWYLTNSYQYAFWLGFPILLWLIILFIGLYNIGREKRIREFYIGLLTPKENKNETGFNTIREKSTKLEDNLTNSRKWIFVLSILSVVFMLVSLGCFLLKFKGS